MIELFIDGWGVDLTPECTVMLSLSVAQLTEPASHKPAKFRFDIPATRKNRTLMEFADQILSGKLFNQSQHTGTVVCNGITLLNGEVEFVRSGYKPVGEGFYRINLTVPAPLWISRAARIPLQDIPIGFEARLSAQTIQESWENDSPVKFLPVKRDAYPDYGRNQVTLQKLDYENYHPFVQVKALLDGIIGQAGYRIESQFLNEDFFKSLYMSGAYPEAVDPDAGVRLDFQAYRSGESATAIAGEDGRIYAAAQPMDHSVGNFVDAGKPYPGNPYDEAAPFFGQSFRMMDGRPAFVPDLDLVAGFEFHCSYVSQVRIESLEKLSGVDRIWWEDSLVFESSFPNPLTDRKNTAGKAGGYRVYCFYFEPEQQRRISVYDEKGVPEIFEITEQAQAIILTRDPVFAVLETFSDGQFIENEGSAWAFYSEEEYAGLPEYREVEAVFRCQPKLRKENKPVFFDTLVFEGIPGNWFTLQSGATVKPVFYTMQVTGENITFATIFAHQTQQMKLVQALAHLFGLYFYTDEGSKTVYIEPGFTFLSEGQEIDWSAKIDPQKEICLEECGGDRNQVETHLYKTGDAAVDRVNARWRTVYGAWSASVQNRFASETEKKIINPLYTATKDETDSLGSATSASMLVAGDRENSENLNFPAKIVQYLGIRQLPDGQRWGWPSYGNQYPLAMFHAAGHGWFTLCFDDIGGLLGLKNYLLPEYNRINTGKN